MKTLLLALAVVAFVCLGSADQQRRKKKPDLHNTYCFQCTAENHWYKCPSAARCTGISNKCYTLYKLDENGGKKWAVKGCAFTCPTAGPGEKVKCCLYNGCNEY
uniref:Three-Finger Toxin 01 n=1 Tax=Boiga dendrophila TaxID=46286 RepID=A0A481MQK7_BOIDE